MFDYLDIVRSKRPLTQPCPGLGAELVPEGTEGTIVMVYDERVGSKVIPGEPMRYEVEFADEDETVMTISENDLELVESYSDRTHSDT